ncbi:L-tyrosine 3-hydroxylase [Actinosynnema sp. NPDC053489]|uniref:L-tyrosine 3-hydroxylase n=1 Tax=Actinosynnema sp. NPDC053489 TaxID=3363916 RepID=UPI0037C635FE
MSTPVAEVRPADAGTAPGPDPFAEPALLRLPWPDAPFTSGDDCADPSCVAHADPTRPPDVPRRWPEVDRDGTIGWYRWIVGHHAAVCAWRLMVERLTDALAGAPGAGTAVAELFDAYSALLLYSGSCSPETYAAVIRARMKARHPAFSGTWARDHEHVTALVARFRPHAGTRLKQALKFNGYVHMGVGRRLVPAGKSLLRESGGHAGAVTEADRDRFDEFFLIDRAPVCAAGFEGQTAERVGLALADLAVRPADVDYGDDRVNALQAALPTHLERLRDLARPAPRRDTP